MFLLQNVYTSNESASYVVSSKLLQTLKAAIKERDEKVSEHGRNHVDAFLSLPCRFAGNVERSEKGTGSACTQ